MVDTPQVVTAHVDDRRVPLRVLDGSPPADVTAVIVPAMGVPARHYDHLAGVLARAGQHVVTVELPGSGDSPVTITRAIEIGYQDLVDGEIDAALGFARDRWPATRRVLVGHSLGGQLSLLHAAVHGDQVDAIALPAAGTIHWRAYPLLTGLGILAFTQLARLTARVLGVFPGDRLGFGGRQPRRLIDDWARTAVTGRWRPAGATVDYEDLLSRIRQPVLSLTLEGDGFAPPSAAAALTAAVPAQRVAHVHVPREELDGRSDHLDWLRTPEPVATRISAWLQAELGDPRRG